MTNIEKRIEVLENAIDNLEWKDHWSPADFRQMDAWRDELYRLKKELKK